MTETVFSFETHSATETECAGRTLAEYLLEHEPHGAFVAMYGDLGAGKTAFVRGVAEIIAPRAAVQSPTYTVVNEYHGGGRTLFHFDLYRIDDEDSLDSVAYWDYLERGGYLFAEWCEKIPYAIPEEHYTVTVSKHPEDEDLRTVTVTHTSDINH